MIDLDLLRHPEKEVTLTPVDMLLAFREAVRKKATIRENAHEYNIKQDGT